MATTTATRIQNPGIGETTEVVCRTAGEIRIMTADRMIAVAGTNPSATSTTRGAGKTMGTIPTPTTKAISKTAIAVARVAPVVVVPTRTSETWAEVNRKDGR